MIKVKLKDTTSIFRDASQDVTIEGDKTFEVQRTSTIQNALIGGALVLVTGETPEAKKEEEPKKEEPKGESKEEEPKGETPEAKKEEGAQPFTRLSKADYNKLSPEDKKVYDAELAKQSGK